MKLGYLPFYKMATGDSELELSGWFRIGTFQRILLRRRASSWVQCITSSHLKRCEGRLWHGAVCDGINMELYYVGDIKVKVPESALYFFPYALVHIYTMQTLCAPHHRRGIRVLLLPTSSACLHVRCFSTQISDEPMADHIIPRLVITDCILFFVHSNEPSYRSNVVCSCDKLMLL